jgi:hypothetical protein
MANEYSFMDPAMGFMEQSPSTVVNVTAATLLLSRRRHVGRTIVLNRAGGIAVTLPPAVGSGDKYRLIVGTTFTSSATIKVANASDVMIGNTLQAADGGSTLNMFEAGATDDTITFNGTTTGGYKGDSVELIDIGLNTWWVRVVGAGTGTEATPFSATVS